MANPGDVGTGTAVAGAATDNHNSGVVTSESLTTAAGVTYTLTLSNNNVIPSSVVVASVALGSSTQGDPIVTQVTPGNGSVVIAIKNDHATLALNGTIKIAFGIL